MACDWTIFLLSHEGLSRPHLIWLIARQGGRHPRVLVMMRNYVYDIHFESAYRTPTLVSDQQVRFKFIHEQHLLQHILTALILVHLTESFHAYLRRTTDISLTAAIPNVFHHGIVCEKGKIICKVLNTCLWSNPPKDTHMSLRPMLCFSSFNKRNEI